MLEENLTTSFSSYHQKIWDNYSDPTQWWWWVGNPPQIADQFRFRNSRKICPDWFINNYQHLAKSRNESNMKKATEHWPTLSFRAPHPSKGLRPCIRHFEDPIYHTPAKSKTASNSPFNNWSGSQLADPKRAPTKTHTNETSPKDQEQLRDQPLVFVAERIDWCGRFFVKKSPGSGDSIQTIQSGSRWLKQSDQTWFPDPWRSPFQPFQKVTGFDQPSQKEHDRRNHQGEVFFFFGAAGWEFLSPPKGTNRWRDLVSDPNDR